MVSKNVKIVNSEGFHMRPVSAFVKEMSQFTSDVKIEAGDKVVNGKSVMNLMAAGIRCGAEINVVCTGDDEEAALNAAIAMIESGFGEK
ncbi:MAG: HPr family phosphocarrier protein [Clostridia bacterium]|nr:HPr family phosphocarrier protein [Clostridia bacterium]MDO5302698.1 HPr family phosphocarrier protein [Clostridia bacterium]